MSFFWPHALWLLLLPLGLLVAELTRRVRAAAARHPKILRAEASPRGLTLAEGGNPVAAMPKVRWRLWLGLALVVTALARPQWGEIEEPVFEQAREILIGVDLSKSMLAPDVAPSRLDRAKLLITGLLDQLEGERVGLAVFAGTAFLQSPMSADYEILQEFLPALDPAFLPEGGTEYAALLDTALEAFSTDSNADRFLIVLSDGESQTEAWRDRLATLRDRGIRVISLGVGTTAGSMLPDGTGSFIKDERGAVVMSRLNPTTLEELARSTSGVYRDASAWVDLAELIGQTVEMGRAGEFAETRQARRIERFQWLLGPALFLMLWSLWREFPVRPRQRAVTIRPTPPKATGTATAAVTIFLILSPPDSAAVKKAAVPDPTALPEIPAEAAPDPGAPVAALVNQLSQQENVAATEFAELAKATINWGNQVLQTGQPVTETVVYDALDAVTLGESIDVEAADWPLLRKELEKLLEQSEQQQQQNQDQQDESENEEQESEDQSENQDQSGEGENEQDQSGEQGENGEQGEQGENSENGESGENQDSENQSGENGDQSSDQDPNKDQEGESSGSPEQQDPTEQERQNAQRAFDEDSPAPEQNQPEPQPQPQPNPGNQSVGGQQVQDQEAANNPELVVPLQKLDQIKDGDSPARLHQLMQDPNAQPPDSGRDW